MKKLFLGMLLLPCGYAFGKSDDFKQTIVAHSCVFKDTNVQAKILAHKNDYILAEVNHSDLMSIRDQKGHTKCGSFQDVSSEWNTEKIHFSSQSIQSAYAQKLLTSNMISTDDSTQNSEDDFTLTHPEEVKELLSYFNEQKMWEGLLKLTSFQNRYANSQYGVDAAAWLKENAETLAKENGRDDVTTEYIDTGLFFKQPSVIVKIPGTDPTLDAILVGGHMDTTNGDKPGADDDGSGSATAMEVMRSVFTSGKKFKRTIYFAWYAAEEAGLVGSNFVAKEFSSRNTKLFAVLHFDMTGYQPKPENKIYVLDDYVNTPLTSFVVDLAKTYTGVEVGHTKCGYACSDHASWTKYKYRSAATFEGTFDNGSPFIHTTADKPDTISATHMGRFAKVGLAFVAELAS